MEHITKPSPLASLKIADFRNFVIARFFMVLAVQMQMTTIGFQVYYEYTEHLGERDRIYILGMIGLYEVIPFILTSFVSGHIADLANRKWIIISSIFTLTIGSFFLVALSNDYFPSLEKFTYYPLLAIVSLFGIARAFFGGGNSCFYEPDCSAEFVYELGNVEQYNVAHCGSAWSRACWSDLWLQ